MTLGVGDVFAVIIALGSCLALIITSAIQNARLTRARDEYRTAYLELKYTTNPREPFTRETW
jgi:hypothetical protein